jgi:anti-anti-sigma factor
LPVQYQDGCAVVVLPAEIDIGNAPVVGDVLRALLDQGASGLVADMTGTSFCDVAGVREILRAYRQAQSLGAWVRVVVPQRLVRRIFTLTGAEGLVMIYPELDAALPCPAGPSRHPAVGED